MASGGCLNCRLIQVTKRPIEVRLNWQCCCHVKGERSIDACEQSEDKQPLLPFLLRFNKQSETKKKGFWKNRQG